MKIRLITLCICSMLFLSTAVAQQKVQVRPAVVVVRGDLHPEQIPDSKAARLFLMDISVPVNATPEQLGVQASQLSNLNLNADDQRTLTSHLAAFRFQFDHLVAEYNRRATWA